MMPAKFWWAFAAVLFVDVGLLAWLLHLNVDVQRWWKRRKLRGWL